jgi:dTDP-4-dehydrorhamnose 3,5-epimerase
MTFAFKIKSSKKFPEVKILQPEPHFDHRGEMWTFYDEDFNLFDSNLNFKISKFSISQKNVLRGLHSDNFTWKYISCVYGEIMLVVVDNRKDSKTYLEHEIFLCSDKNHLAVLVPPKFANGHLCLSEICNFHYMQSYPDKYIDTDQQEVIKWDDKRLNIKWPISDPILSERDK